MNLTDRTLKQRQAHYQIEKGLATQLRHAQASQRHALYVSLYEELFRQVPDHPQLLRKQSAQEFAAQLELQVARLTPFLTPTSRFLEIGCGDGRLARQIATQVQQVYAVDVSTTITQQAEPPPINLHPILVEGVALPLPEATIDVAYSNQLMEHLHPDDVLEQLHHIYRVLVPGGVYLCVTPNRASGPHDISQGFDEVATGLHLHEYTLSELAPLLRSVGFTKLALQVELRAQAALWPVAIGLLCENLIDHLPKSTKRQLASRFPLRNLLGIRMIARKS